VKVLRAFWPSLLAGVSAREAWAEESQFGYVYTTDLLPRGQTELEQWATWRHQKIGVYTQSSSGLVERVRPISSGPCAP
jgi:hypothetical protein